MLTTFSASKHNGFGFSPTLSDAYSAAIGGRFVDFITGEEVSGNHGIGRIRIGPCPVVVVTCNVRCNRSAVVSGRR